MRKKKKLEPFSKLEAQKFVTPYLDLLSNTQTDFLRKKALFSERKNA